MFHMLEICTLFRLKNKCFEAFNMLNIITGAHTEKPICRNLMIYGRIGKNWTSSKNENNLEKQKKAYI